MKPMRLTASAAVYLVGDGLITLGNLVVVFLYWRFLAKAEYGLLACFGIFTLVTGPLFLVAITTHLLRIPHADDPARLDRAAKAIHLAVLVWSVVLSLLILGLGLVKALDGVFKAVPFAPVLGWATVACAATALMATPFALLQARGQVWRHRACGLILAVGGWTASMTVVMGLHLGGHGLVAAQAVTAAVLSLLLSSWWWTTLAPGPADWSVLRPAVRLGLPLAGYAVLGCLGLIAGRYVIERRLTLDQLSDYSVPLQVSALLAVVFQSVNQAWLPHYARLYAAGDGGSAVAQVYSRYAIALLQGSMILGCGIVLVADPLIHWVSAGRYGCPPALLAPLVAATIIASVVWTLQSNPLFVAGRTGRFVLFTASGSVVGLLTAWFAVEQLGMVGAAWSAVAGAVATVVPAAWLRRQVQPMHGVMRPTIVIALLATVTVLGAEWLFPVSGRPGVAICGRAALLAFLVLVQFRCGFLDHRLLLRWSGP